MPNHLLHEKSPYLKQHATNPIDWYPWGNEPFALAQTLDKPIFLSIGYATCHFCHLMEEESFSDPEVGKIMNEVFISIKVDREEWPEVDSLYMELAQPLLPQGGGWPLNLVLTHDRKPFFALTYLPKRTEEGMLGMIEFAEQIREIWEGEDRELFLGQADQLVEILRRSIEMKGEELPSPAVIAHAIEEVLELADSSHGGLLSEPKFPLPYHLNLLLAIAKAQGNSRALFYVELTLEHMSRGGIYDQLGGGFSRYSTDHAWEIPHFEKMLYDNALLVMAYLDAWKWLHKESHEEVIRATCDYLLRELSSPEGGLYSSQDADSGGEEGRFYTWSVDEIYELLPEELAELFCHFYGVTDEGNFSSRNVLYAPLSLKEFAQGVQLDDSRVAELLDQARTILFQARQKRVPPSRDEKQITAWNGLAAKALLLAGKSLEEERYTQAAVKALHLIRSKLFFEGKLLRRYCEGEARFDAVLEDYAYLISALLTFFEWGMGTEWLAWAIELADGLELDFKAPGGAFYSVAEDDKLLLHRTVFYDGAEPSGNSVHAENLLRLYKLCQKKHYLYQAQDIFKAAQKNLEEHPQGALYLVGVLNRYYDSAAPLVVVVLDQKKSLQKEIETLLAHTFSPHRSVIWKEEADLALTKLLPFLEDKPMLGETTVYICTGDHCEAPLVGKEAILDRLRQL